MYVLNKRIGGKSRLIFPRLFLYKVRVGYINYVSKYGTLFILFYTGGKIVNLELMFSCFPLPLYIILSIG